MLQAALSRRSLLRAGALGLSSFAGLGLAGCGGGSGKGSAAGEGGELNVFMWSEYIPEDNISGFEDETGIKVNTSTYDTNEDLLSKLKGSVAGTYDLIMPTGYMVSQMVDQGLLQKIDTSKLENLKNISSSFLGKDYDPDNSYSVPYMASLTCIVANGDKLPRKVGHWEDLLDGKFKDQLVVYNNVLEVMAILCRIVGSDDYFGEMDESVLSKVEDLAMQLKTNVKLYDFSCYPSFINQEVSAGIAYSAHAALSEADVPSIEAIYPDEGCNLAIDNWAIPKDSKNVDGALQFIDYIYKPECGKRACEEYPYTQPNQAAVDLMDDDYKNDPARNVPEEVIDKAYVYSKPVSSDVLAKYNAIWDKMKK